MDDELVSREEIVGLLFTVTDILVDVGAIRRLLEEEDDEEADEG